MERPGKRSRSAGPSVKSGKKYHSKAKATSNYNKAMNKARSTKLSAARIIANAATSGFLGIEKKFLDMTKAPTTIVAAAALTTSLYDPTSGCLSCPAQGDTEQSRDGKRIVIDSLIIKGFVDNAGTASTAVEVASKIFVAIVLDTQTNVAQMTGEGCFKNLGAVDSLNANPTKNLLSGNRFRILKSQVFDLTPNGAFAAGANYASNQVRRDFDWYIPFKGGLPVNLNAGTTSDVANVIDNSLHVVAFATLAGCAIAYNARIRFQG